MISKATFHRLVTVAFWTSAVGTVVDLFAMSWTQVMYHRFPQLDGYGLWSKVFALCGLILIATSVMNYYWLPKPARVNSTMK